MCTTCPRTQGELQSTSGFIAPPERRAPGDATGSLCLALYAIIFIEFYSNFMSVLVYLKPYVVCCFFFVSFII
jgi:hypothetical protein